MLSKEKLEKDFMMSRRLAKAELISAVEEKNKIPQSHLELYDLFAKQKEEIEKLKKVIKIALKIINLPKVKIDEDLLAERDLKKELKQSLAKLEEKC